MSYPNPTISVVLKTLPDTYSEGGNLELYVPKEIIPQFKQLISKALNSFPDAHPALKELGDMLTHGKVLQDYYSQRTDKQLIAPSDC